MTTRLDQPQPEVATHAESALAHLSARPGENPYKDLPASQQMQKGLEEGARAMGAINSSLTDKGAATFPKAILVDDVQPSWCYQSVPQSGWGMWAHLNDQGQPQYNFPENDPRALCSA